ncbi:NADP-dependent oxidoreductase [Candidatus Sumerlaeota bacterium]|nr:NADP-dependent oxidoreductase [Candidatus Sumerlaeota bacterium]
MATNRQITLAARPAGYPKESDFKLVEVPVPALKDGEFLIHTIYLSVDPYMRGRMNDRKSYAQPVAIGGVMTGGIVGRVVESKHPGFKVGEIVAGDLGWQEYPVSNGKGVEKVDPALAPISTALGILGLPGMTAYFGLTEICKPKAGETVVVSGAAGAVGSLVGQIAKILGCRAVGSAGTDEKVEYITRELGFDGAFNYKKTDNYVAKLRELCPSGIDCYFDNVGGPVTDAVMMLMNPRARIAVCGQIALYNAEKPEMGPRLLALLIERQAKIEGFLVYQFLPRYKEGRERVAQWLKEGKIKYRETITDGLENAPKAFIGMLHGENTGKQLVRVSAE